MQTSTGKIGQFESEEAAKRAGFDKILSKEQYNHVKPMNRAQRRKWARDQKRKTN